MKTAICRFCSISRCAATLTISVGHDSREQDKLLSEKARANQILLDKLRSKQKELTHQILEVRFEALEKLYTTEKEKDDEIASLQVEIASLKAENKFLQEYVASRFLQGDSTSIDLPASNQASNHLPSETGQPDQQNDV